MTTPAIPNHFDLLIAALETARKQVCVYAGPTCDCKYGLIPYNNMPAAVHTCEHHLCEHTGCPELRDLIASTEWTRRTHEFGPNHGCPRGFTSAPAYPTTNPTIWRCSNCGADCDPRGNLLATDTRSDQ